LFLKKYYPEIIVFGFIFAMLMIDLNPDFTFINKAADSIGYAYSAKYLYPSFHTSPPLYLVVSHFFLMIPFGTDAWRMGLFSLLSTMGACTFIYLTIRKLIPGHKYYPLLGVLIYGCSALVISQSIIIQTYAITCMLASGAFYFATTKHWKLTALFIGMGLIVHLLMFFIALIMIIGYKDLRKSWKNWLIMGACLVGYLYIPITNRPPYMWMPDPVSVSGNFPPFLVNIYSFVVDTLSTIGFLIGKLSVWDIPKRLLDTIGIMGVSIGILTIVPIVIYFRKKFYTNILFWLIMTPILVFIVELDMNTFDYTMVAMPFLSIVACLGLYKMMQSPTIKTKVFSYVMVTVVAAFGVYNFNYFDIGRTLDKNLGASQLYYGMDKIPDGSIFMPNGAWEWEAIFLYNKEFNRHIYPVAIDILPSHQYTNQLQKDGVKLIVSTEVNKTIQARQTAMSIIELNDNVYTTVYTDTSTFSSDIVLTNHNTSYVDIYDKDYADSISLNPQIHWIPSNPYDIITTSIMIDEWNYVLLSRYNIALFIMVATIAYGFIFVMTNIFRKKKHVIIPELPHEKETKNS
jgi:hypothetical protein